MKVIFFANTDWYLYNFRLALARFLRDQGFEVVMLSPNGPYGPLLVAAGFRWICLDMNRRSLNPVREFGLLRKIKKVYAVEKPDIVHHFTIKCVVYGSLAARWHGTASRINAVTGMGHVFSTDGIRARLLRPVVRRLMKAALNGRGSRLILQNNDDIDAFRQAGLARTECTYLILGSGVDTARFYPIPTRGSKTTMRVLLASRLLWDKGIGEYVQAARIIKNAGLAIEFVLAGTPDRGNPASVSLHQLEQWQHDAAIEYVGQVADMPELLAGIDVAVLPSYREGLPRSLLEAAACGLPIVTTDTPGCREVVQHKVNGLLVPARDASALAAAIRYLFEQPEERRRMGEAARSIAVNAFDQRIVFQKTYQVYGDLLSSAAEART